MTRKRRMFEIDMPAEAGTEGAKAAPEPVAKKPGRSPMAAAITENAEALTARKSAAEAIREENDALAHEFVALREAGHVVREIPLDEVHTYMLVRDRIPGEEDWELKIHARMGKHAAEGPLYIEFFREVNGQEYIVYRHEDSNYGGERN